MPMLAAHVGVRDVMLRNKIRYVVPFSLAGMVEQLNGLVQ
jgi:hypothetical protein